MSDDHAIRLAPGVFIDEENIAFRFVQSSGPGGQNVNKRATKAEMRVDIQTLGLGQAARLRLRRLAGHLVTDGGEIIISSDRTRSQRRNRDDCLERLSRLVAKAIEEPIRRRPTKPSAGSVRRRLEAKRRRGEIKRNRRDPD